MFSLLKLLILLFVIHVAIRSVLEFLVNYWKKKIV